MSHEWNEEMNTDWPVLKLAPCLPFPESRLLTMSSVANPQQTSHTIDNPHVIILQWNKFCHIQDVYYSLSNDIKEHFLKPLLLYSVQLHEKNIVRNHIHWANSESFASCNKNRVQ